MSALQPVTMETFDSVMETHPLVVLDFWAAWCGPCKTFAPVYTEMAAHHPGIFFGTVDVENAQDLAAAFQVRSVPTLMAFREGELVFERAGLLSPPALQEMLGLLS